MKPKLCRRVAYVIADRETKCPAKYGHYAFHECGLAYAEENCRRLNKKRDDGGSFAVFELMSDGALEELRR